MNAPIFVDADVLLHSFDTSEPSRQVRAASWLEWLWSRGLGRTSYHVLDELYVSLTSRLTHPLPPQDARTVVRSLVAWRPQPTDPQTIEQAWSIQDRYEVAWWACLTAASAMVQNCAYVLTEGLQHNRNLGGLVVINPFTVFPTKLTEHQKP